MSAIDIWKTGADASVATATESVDDTSDVSIEDVAASEPQPKSANEATNVNTIFIETTIAIKPGRILSK